MQPTGFLGRRKLRGDLKAKTLLVSNRNTSRGAESELGDNNRVRVLEERLLKLLLLS